MIRRRFLLAAALVASSASKAMAAPSAAPSAAVVNLPSVGLPVIESGRVRNYVFVQARLHLASGRNPDALRPKIPYFRDALVRAAHRTSFARTDTWLTLNDQAMAAALMRAAPAIAGAGTVARVEIVTQTPRRRTGMRGA